MSPVQKRSAASKVKGVITNIQAYSLHDGPGIRTLVFLKGCPLLCEWCCNPECQRQGTEVEFCDSECIRCGACLEACDRKAINPDLELKTGYKIAKNSCDDCGNCVRVCPKGALRFTGEIVTADEVLEEVNKDRYYHLTSRGGLTITGGEPLYQFEFTRQLLRTSYYNNVETGIETCGYAPWRHLKAIIGYSDLILYDVKHMDPAKHKQGTGVSNEIILSNLTKLSRSGVPIIVRMPLIPQYNLGEDNVNQTAKFITTLENVIEVNLLPFHQLGKDKYGRLSREYSLKYLKALELDRVGTDRIKEIKTTLESYGLNITVG